MSEVDSTQRAVIQEKIKEQGQIVRTLKAEGAAADKVNILLSLATCPYEGVY